MLLAEALVKRQQLQAVLNSFIPPINAVEGTILASARTGAQTASAKPWKVAPTIPPLYLLQQEKKTIKTSDAVPPEEEVLKYLSIAEFDAAYTTTAVDLMEIDYRIQLTNARTSLEIPANLCKHMSVPSGTISPLVVFLAFRKQLSQVLQRAAVYAPMVPARAAVTRTQLNGDNSEVTYTAAKITQKDIMDYVDKLSQALREVDAVIQKANWSTELV